MARGATRDHSIDLLRGLMLVCMIAGHIAPLSLASRIIHFPLLLDAASGFVALSGFTLGMLHRRALLHGRPGYANGRLVARAAMVLALNLVIVGVLLSYDRLVADVGLFTDEVRALPLPLAIAEAGVLHLRPRIPAILPVFVVCFLAAPLLLGCLGTRWEAVPLLAIGGAYAAAWWLPDLPKYGRDLPGIDSCLNPVSWLLPYALCLSIGYHFACGRREEWGRAWGRMALAAASCVLFALLAFSTLQRQSFAGLGLAASDEALRLWFARVTHAPGRLAYLLATLVVAFRVSDWALGHPRILAWSAPLRELGSRSLLVYAYHFVPFGLLAVAGFGNGVSPGGEIALGAVLLGGWLIVRLAGRGRHGRPDSCSVAVSAKGAPENA